jgi:uncharacterized membrane protein YeaQ/YmgE (transglycosylase-associated protein family)
MLAADIDITVGDILIYILAGLVIGVIARLLVPGRQSMGMVATIVLGIVAAVVGGILWELLFPNNDGIAWIGSIIVAIVLLVVWERLAGRRGPVT